MIRRPPRSTLFPYTTLFRSLYPLIPDRAGPLVDLGSGAGFPGLVLAIMGVRDVHLVERDQRKAVFLREAVRVTAADAQVHARDIDTVALDRPAAVVTARALAPLPLLIRWADALGNRHAL